MTDSVHPDRPSDSVVSAATRKPTLRCRLFGHRWRMIRGRGPALIFCRWCNVDR